MIEYLRGILLEKGDNHLVLDVGGVGYGLTVPATTLRGVGEPGAETALWVLTYVREDVLRLFGFLTRHEREVFEVFIGISGVGPAIGLALLSSLTVGEIIQATMTGDVRHLKSVKGIGQKMAEKLLLELKGRVTRLAEGLAPEELQQAVAAETPLPTEAARDAVAALEALEVRPAQARRAVGLALDALGVGASVEALVREGLKYRR
ncbi:MAG: Holliday junction branch migration protein RuvA [bacterium]|nr:Holliday junction branch migration protein RuvA [bacterium]